LTTSGITGNLLAFEIFIFICSIDNTMKHKTEWICKR